MRKGVFWCDKTEPARLITVSVRCTADGTASAPVEYSSKSGDNFNHEAEWAKLGKSVTGGHPYNYYPRERVEIKNRKAVVYLNPDINRAGVIEKIFEAFGLADAPELSSVEVKSDGSKHYGYMKQI